jgi:hypothetical protein
MINRKVPQLLSSFHRFCFLVIFVVFLCSIFIFLDDNSVNSRNVTLEKPNQFTTSLNSPESLQTPVNSTNSTSAIQSNQTKINLTSTTARYVKKARNHTIYLSLLEAISTSRPHKDLCPLEASNLTSKIPVNENPIELEELEALLEDTVSPEIGLGGKWSPRDCQSRHKVAIIVPYRNREHNLQVFLRHMHQFLSKQQLEYGIYLAEPLKNVTFNRGLLMNAGFLEALRDDPKWTCFVFHDVDLLPENEQNVYNCSESPRHLSSAVSTFQYK